MKRIVVAIFAICISVSMLQAQETDEKTDKENGIESLFIKLKEGAKPDIYVDEKKFDFPLELIDQSKISAVFVVKDAEKLKEYDAPNGLVFITTKMRAESEEFKKKAKMDEHPMVIVDGKISNKGVIKEIDPNDIESVSVVKGEQAITEYNAPNGVIIITTKK